MGDKKQQQIIIHPSKLIESGGKLSFGDLGSLLKGTYNKKNDKIKDWELDKEISGDKSKVYRNPATNQVVVAHRGTSGFSDWFNNLVYGVGGERLYKYTKRYKDAEKVQKQAEKKYDKNKISTIGHSQGGLQAKMLGKDTHEIITLNRASRPFEDKNTDKQYDVKLKHDLVSKSASSHKNDIIKPSGYNPIASHTLSGDFENIPSGDTVGAGIGTILTNAKYLIKDKIDTAVSNIQNKVEGLIPSTTHYTPTTQRYLDQYGHFKIIDMLIIKTPVAGAVMKLAGVLTAGQVQDAMKKEGIDTFFHIAMRTKQMDDNGNIISMLYEKNENISIRPFVNSDIAMNSKTLLIDITKTPQFNLREMMERTRLHMGNKLFFGYNALINNCGDFIIHTLMANYLYTQSDDAFLYQTDVNGNKKDLKILKKHINSSGLGRLNLITKMGAYVRKHSMFGGAIRFI